jgi:putative DNA primase/helicase
VRREELLGAMNESLDAALSYAARGWNVFPCHAVIEGRCTCGQPACDKPGKHPRTAHGFKDATTDASVIRAWWERWPEANVAIATGQCSRLAVLDVDDYAGGDDELRELERVHGALPDAPVSLTGGGGRQFLFERNGVAIVSRNGVVAPHIDVKADGGYIIAPPSSHLSGRRYAWDGAAHPDDVPLSPAPKFMESPIPTAAKPALRRHSIVLRQTWRDRANGLPEDDVLRRALDSTEGRELIAEGREDEIRRMISGAFAKDPGHFHLTDLGNARRFVYEYGQDVRYCYTSKSWLVWTGSHWRRDASAAVERFAKETVLGLYAEAATSADEDRRKRIAAHAAKSERADRIAAMLRLAQSEPEVCITDEALDRDGWLLNVANGTLDLRTDELRPHRPEDLITYVLPVAYDPAAKAPTWTRFLARVLNYDDDLHAFLQRAVGYSLTAETTEQCFFLLHGGGKNGKTTFLETIRALFGELARNSRFETFLVKRQDQIPSDIARLRGARLVTACEAQDGRRLDEATIKDLTGGDTVTARLRYQDEREFRPTCKLWLSSNHKPVIRGQDVAIWRRVKLVPFVVEIPEADRDPDMAAKLKTELLGVLAWAVEGARRWRLERLGSCAAVESHTREYRSEQDTVGAWLSENCSFEPRAEVLKSDLFAAYRKSADEAGERFAPNNTFARRLFELHPEVTDRKSGRNRYWVGVELR